jgi:hypothetical protein
MMGSRGCRGGDECDAFSRRSRHILGWKRGELGVIKRRYSKRTRKAARCATLQSATARVAHPPEEIEASGKTV